MTQLRIAPPTTEADRTWLSNLWQAEWGGDFMISRGKRYQLWELHALLAFDGEEPVGAVTYHLSQDGCEVMSLNATAEGRGVGSALLSTVEGEASRLGLSRVWLITSNDNLDALRFYQRRGYRMVAIHAGAVDEARQQKPAIPLIGYHGIPLHDEIELAKSLG